jgi:hypothetical protein
VDAAQASAMREARVGRFMEPPESVLWSALQVLSALVLGCNLSANCAGQEVQGAAFAVSLSIRDRKGV